MDARIWRTRHTLKKANAKIEEIIEFLLSARGIEKPADISDFFSPPMPKHISLSEVGLEDTEIKKLIKRLKQAKEKNEQVIVFGDYDTDGVSATAIMWEALYAYGFKVMPYLPNRFDEGYGIQANSIEKLKNQYPDLGLIITVDNGIVAFKAALKAKELSVNLVISDHHKPGDKKPDVLAIIHTAKMSGSGVAWFIVRELNKIFNGDLDIDELLGLAALGTVADQLPLLGINRSLVTHGIQALRKTSRPGILALCWVAHINQQDIGTYEINYILAPHINAMGRLEHALDSLRLLCTKSQTQAQSYAYLLGKTNTKRQQIVEEVIAHASDAAKQKKWKNIIILAHESYHEGVIGLAASKLVEHYYLPAIVMSEKDGIYKASARSINGFNIIDAIRKLETYLLSGGGHEMAAGFSIKKDDLGSFINEIDKITASQLTEDMRLRKLFIDLELGFDLLSWDLAERLLTFEPCGVGNFTPVFQTRGVEIKSSKILGRDGKHLGLSLQANEREYPAIAFGFGEYAPELPVGKIVDVAYNLDINRWNGKESLQLKIKDIKPQT